MALKNVHETYFVALKNFIMFLYMKAYKFNVLVQNRISGAIIQTFNKDCVIAKVIAQSIKKRKGENFV